jgi:hypothetical protein
VDFVAERKLRYVLPRFNQALWMGKGAATNSTTATSVQRNFTMRTATLNVVVIASPRRRVPDPALLTEPSASSVEAEW